MAKQTCWCFRCWKSCMFCQIYCWRVLLMQLKQYPAGVKADDRANAMWQLHYVQQFLIDVATVYYQTTHAACISISECRCIRSFSWFHAMIPQNEKHACSSHGPMPAKVILPLSISRCRVFVNPLCRLGSTRRHCCNSLSFSETQLLTSKAFGA